MGHLDPAVLGFGFLFALAILGCSIAVVALVCYHRRALRMAEMTMMLKQEMVQKGLSADEIERVLRASGPNEQTPPNTAQTRLAELRREFITELLDRDVSAVDVERLVKTLGTQEEAAPGSEAITDPRRGVFS
jgi:hypothetical protein